MCLCVSRVILFHKKYKFKKNEKGNCLRFPEDIPPISILRISCQFVACKYTTNYSVQHGINPKTNSVLERCSSNVAENRISVPSNLMNQIIPQ